MSRQEQDKPSEKQVKTMELIKQGVPTPEAMIRAGYSANSASSPTHQFWNQQGTQKLLSEMKIAYDNLGVDIPYLAKKNKQHLEATKKNKAGEVEQDYQTQLKAGEIARKDLELWQDHILPDASVINNTYIFDENTADAFAEYLKAKTEQITGSNTVPPQQ